MLVVHPKLGVKTVAELIAYAKQNPNQLTYSSGGNGSAAHTAMEYFKLQTGIQAVHIPYKGTSPAVTDVIGGQVDMIMTGVPPLMPFIQSGKVMALGVSTLKRIEALPQVPAISETPLPALKSFDVTQWYGLVVKVGTSKEIIQMLNVGVQHTFNHEAAIEQMKNAGAIVRVSTPAEFAAFIRLEIDRWAKVVKAADIQPG